MNRFTRLAAAAALAAGVTLAVAPAASAASYLSIANQSPVMIGVHNSCTIGAWSTPIQPWSNWGTSTLSCRPDAIFVGAGYALHVVANISDPTPRAASDYWCDHRYDNGGECYLNPRTTAHTVNYFVGVLGR